MKTITLGSTGITAPQNGFGVLPIQRVPKDRAVKILRRAYEGGMRFYDTARAYSDSEEKLGEAFEGMWDRIFIATKTMARTTEEFRKHLDTSLKKLRTDHVDIYQFHCADRCYRPGDGTGMYECMLEARAAGKIRHIGVTAHKLGIAAECVRSGLYETLQFPFSYLSGPEETGLVRLCEEKNVGFIAMKALAGGLITRSDVSMAFFSQFDNTMPIWGVQRENELEEWLSYMEATPVMTPETAAFIEKEKKELSGEFCRGCGYCEPCPAGIMIHQCARMALMLRRMPAANWLTEGMQDEMKKIEGCLHCGQCMEKCPYGLKTPDLLEKNYEDYKKVLAGEVTV